MKQSGLRNRLWAITSYFNPMRYRSRLENYRIFRSRLDAQLLTVELGYDDSFELTDRDADLLVRCRDGDVLWQKERLLNVALERLPPSCDLVAWLDCDIVFLDGHWQSMTADALERWPLVQLFQRVVELEKGQCIPPAGQMAGRTGLAYGVAQGEIPASVLGAPGLTHLGYSPGHAWAARREIVEDARFYDALIVGSGDKCLAAAAYGKVDEVGEALFFNEAQTEHFRPWGNRVWRLIRGRVGWCALTLAHLWHGQLAHRGYEFRYRHLSQFQFHPAKDLALGHDRCWRWKTQKPSLHQYVRDYFFSRREDD